MFNLSNMKIGARLLTGFGVVTALLVGLMIFSWVEIVSINSAMDKMSAVSEVVLLSQDIGSDIDNISISIWKHMGVKEADKKTAAKESIDAARAEYKKNFGNLSEKVTDQSGKQLLKNFEDGVGNMKEVNNKSLELSSGGKEAEAIALYATEGQVKMKSVDEAGDALIEFEKKQQKAIDDETEAMVARAKMLLLVIGIIAVIVAFALGIFTARTISRPIAASVGLLDHISNGDLSNEVPPELRNRKDEAGTLARAMQTMTETLRKLLGDLTGGIQTLASSSTELSAVAGQTTSSVKNMSSKASTVAAAAEESSSNTTSVAASMEQTTTNLQSVAGATEEMSATVGEIASNSEKARAISDEATVQAQNIGAMMQQLGQAAQEIGKVTETITDISSQTNLLALNATIEAARAGAAGKGFAVVANEIKELARQTATATEDIKAKIAGVQNSAGGAIADIEKISGVIKEVSSIVSSIAAAIEEQATVTKDVAGNIAQASTGVKDANERIAQTATVSKSIAQDISGISSAVEEVAQGGQQVQASAAELSKLAEQLKAMVGQFKV
jgi:methyl-accepting chemotaxis protein